MPLTEAQHEQVERQLAAHTHERYTTDIEVTPELTLRGFIVERGVLRPEVMTSIHLARHLAKAPSLYSGEYALDMGCGTGIQGIVMLRCGARRVTFADIDPVCATNTTENLIAQEITPQQTDVTPSDLFAHISGRFRLVVFNHPFFDGAASPSPAHRVEAAMVARGALLQRFLDQAKRRANIIVMPYYHLAGPENDPAIVAPEHGYDVIRREHFECTTGLQQGTVSIYHLIPPG